MLQMTSLNTPTEKDLEDKHLKEEKKNLFYMEYNSHIFYIFLYIIIKNERKNGYYFLSTFYMLCSYM